MWRKTHIHSQTGCRGLLQIGDTATLCPLSTTSVTDKREPGRFRAGWGVYGGLNQGKSKKKDA
jgi:hypothetical protein